MKFRIQIDFEVKNEETGEIGIEITNKSDEIEENKDLLNDEKYKRMCTGLLLNITNKINS